MAEQIESIRPRADSTRERMLDAAEQLFAHNEARIVRSGRCPNAQISVPLRSRGTRSTIIVPCT